MAGRDLATIDRRKVPYYRRNVGVVFQGLQAPAGPHRRLQRGLRAACDGPTRARRSWAVPHISAPHRALSMSSQLPRPALGRRAAARLGPRAPSSTTRRCCWPTSPRATSTPRPRSGSCSCSTASTARARRSSSPPTTRPWSTACAGGCSALQEGRLVRDEQAGADARRDQHGRVRGPRRQPAPEPQRAPEAADLFDSVFSD